MASPTGTLADMGNGNARAEVEGSGFRIMYI